MKKLLALFLTALLACPLFANEAAIRQILIDFNKHTKNMEIEKMLAVTAPDFTGVTANGRKISYAQISSIPKLVAMCNDPNSKLSEILTVQAIFMGRELSKEQLAYLKSLDDTPDGKTAAQTIKTSFKSAWEEQKTLLKQQADSFKIVSVNVNGDTAVAVYTDFAPIKKRHQKTTAHFAKRNGKWLLVKEITKFI